MTTRVETRQRRWCVFITVAVVLLGVVLTMSWIDGLTKNWAELTFKATDPSLKPLKLSRSPEAAVGWAAEVLSRRPRWSVEAQDPGAGTLHATHKTRLWRFVDDVHLRFEPDPSGGSILTGRSQSRIGKGDFGQNRRNLLELTEALRSEDEAAGSTRRATSGPPGHDR